MTPRELRVLLLLTAISFLAVVDFVVVAPLAPALMQTFAISNQDYSHLIVTFALSSFVCGLLGSQWIDRWNRRHALAALCAVFALGEWASSASQSVHQLFVARGIAGSAAGLMTAVAQAVLCDVFEPKRRGRASGIFNTSLALAFVVGVPLGVWLSQVYSWRVPFGLLATGATSLAVLAILLIPAREASAKHSARQPSKREAIPVFALLINPLLMFAAYCVTPFLPAYLVSQLGFARSTLPGFYVAGGLMTLLATIAVGFATDRYRPASVLFALSIFAAPITWAVTTTQSHHLFWVGFLIATFMVVGTTRLVPGTVILTQQLSESQRGRVMSLNSALQQLGCGAGAWIAGQLLEVHGDPWAGFGRAAMASIIAGLGAAALGLKLVGDRR